MTIETNGETPAPQSETPTSPGGQEATPPSLTGSSQEPPAATPPAATPAPEAPNPDAVNPPAADAAADAENAEAADPWAGQELDEETKAFVGEKTPAQIAKELRNAQALLGKKAIGIPGKDSTPEEHRAFHKARGVPEDETGYNLAPVMEELKEVAPEGWAPSPEYEASFRKAARMANLSDGEAKEFAKHYLSEQFEKRKEFVQKEVTATKDAAAMLAQAWGPDRSVGEANFERGMRAIGMEPESVDVFLAAYGNNAKARFNMVQSIAEIGRRQMEGGPIPGNGTSQGSTAMTKEQAAAEEARIKRDPVLSKAFLEPTHPDHKRVTAEMTRLGRIQRGLPT